MKRAFFLASILLTGLPVAQAEPRIQTNAEIAFLERTSLKAADEKCGYLTELERTALLSGQLQARGVLLRSGLAADAIDTAASEVTRFANLQACGEAAFVQSIQHLKNAFAAFIGTMVQDYPGRDRTWNASRSRWDTWRVVQTGSTDDYLFQFGLLAPDMSDPDAFPASFARPLDAPLPSKPFSLAVDLLLKPTDADPSKAQILIRNSQKLPDPWLGNLFSTEPSPPPRRMTRAFWPTSQTILTDEETGERRARFTFSADAIRAIEALDPREQFEIAIFPDARSSAQPVYLLVETGDFAAAHAFTKLPPL